VSNSVELASDPGSPQRRMKDIEIYLDQIRKSSEFNLGSRFRLSLPFKLFRHFRFRERFVRVITTANSGPLSSGFRVCLLSVWSEEFPKGMPLELLERNLYKWQEISEPAAHFGLALETKKADKIYIYSRHENLRLDFRMDRDCGKIVVEGNGHRKEIDLYSPYPATCSVFPNIGEVEILVENTPPVEYLMTLSSNDEPGQWLHREEFSEKDQAWLERQLGDPKPLSLNNPKWLGILASSKELFDNIFLLPDELDLDKARYYARLFLESNVPSITVQGLPQTYTYLVNAFHQVAPHIPIYAIYHGNFLHMREDYDFGVFRLLKSLHEHGEIAKIGFVKKGMAEIMAATGMRSEFIMNMVRRIPEAASQARSDGTHIGIWGLPDWSWKKPPYAMLAALKLIPGSKGHAINVSPRAKEFGELMSLDSTYVTEAIPQLEVTAVMAQMYLNMYVSLTECAPMMPLESLSIGAPCLLGPTSHYFLDHRYLFDRLVVPSPDDAQEIAKKAQLVLSERDEVIEAYQAFAPEYNQQALQRLAEFLEFSFK
jgi:hypothetical protein